MAVHGSFKTGPGDLLDAFLGAPLPPSASSVGPLHRETTVCYAFLCPYAYACAERRERAAQVLRRRCMRYLPEALRVRPVLSGLALDLLARRRQRGDRLAPDTLALLDRVRPDGPLRTPSPACGPARTSPQPTRAARPRSRSQGLVLSAPTR